MDKDLKATEQYTRAANYLTVAQIFLQDNFLLERPLVPEDIKPRLLGHWGSCPGVNGICAFKQIYQKIWLRNDVCARAGTRFPRSSGEFIPRGFVATFLSTGHS